MNSDSGFSRSIRVAWVDTECTGLAQTHAYVRWMEETEYAFLRDRGLGVSMRDERGQFGFPRLTTSIRIYSPASFDEPIVIAMRVVRNEAKQLEYAFRIVQAEDGRAIAEGRFVVACCRFPAGGLPYAILIPDPIREQIGLAGEWPEATWGVVPAAPGLWDEAG